MPLPLICLRYIILFSLIIKKAKISLFYNFPKFSAYSSRIMLRLLIILGTINYLSLLSIEQFNIINNIESLIINLIIINCVSARVMYAIILIILNEC